MLLVGMNNLDEIDRLYPKFGKNINQEKKKL